MEFLDSFSTVRRGLVRLLLAWALLVSPLLPAENSPPSEYQVKAAFLLHFTQYVEWPASAFSAEHSLFSICVLGEDPFGTALEQMVKGETVNGHELIVQRLQRAPEPKACQILFLNEGEKDTVKVLAAAGPGVLTVGEGDAFLRDGGVIAFVLENRRVRFDINQRAAASSMLAVSSKLLSVARSVVRPPKQ